MKILLLAQHFPPQIGGTPTLYHNICKQLKDQVVVCTQTSPGYKEFDKKQSFKIYRAPKLSHVDAHVFKEVKNILRIIKKENITHLLVGHINFNLTALILKKIFRKPYFLYLHGEEITQDFGGKYYQYFKKKCLKNAQGIIAVSDYTKNLVKKYNPNIKVIYNAVNLKKFKPKKKNKKLIQKYNLKDKTTLLTISRLEKRKGQDQVIKILPQIIKEHPNIKYLIGGTGQEEAHLKNLVKKLNLKKHVEFLSRIPHKKIIDYYNLCDIFIMPNRQTKDSNTEGFGLVFLEANACGKPVIGGQAGGVPSAIKDGYNGFLVNGEEKEDIKNKLIKLIEDKKLRKQLSQNALKWVKSFTYEKLTQQLKDFLINFS